MTDNLDTPTVQTTETTDTAVTGMLTLLGSLPAETAGQILEVSTVKCPSGGWRLDLSVATYQAGWALADAMGLSREEYECEGCATGLDQDEYECECFFLDQDDPVTCWDGGDVQVTHDARDTYPPRGPLDGQALAGHLTRLDEALRADPAAATHLTGAAATPRVYAGTTPAARDLAATLCPHAPAETVVIPARTASWEHWEAHNEDTTICGPSTVHDATDTAADDTYYC